MMRFLFVDVIRGKNPTIRFAFGGCLQTLAFFRATHFLSLRAKKRGPQKILLYFWGKGVCKHKTGNCRLRRLTGQKRSIRRVAISRKGHRIIKPTQDTFVLAWRKKAHTSKRVSIVACENAISKVQLPGTPRDIVYPRGKGAHKHKSEHCRKRQCDFKSAVCAVSSPVNVTSVNVLNRYALTANEERSKRLHLRKSNAADIANNRTRRVKCKALARKRGC